MNKSIFWIVMAIITVVTIIYSLQYDGRVVKAETLDIEVLIDGVDIEPKGKIIGSCVPFTNGIELWHYSGGYWKYKDLIIYDKDFQYGFSDKDLEEAIKEKIIFEYEIEPELYKKLIEERYIKVVCSTTLINEKTMENKLISDLFYDTPTIEIKDGKIYFSAKPKFHFFERNHINYQTIVEDTNLM